jgi:DNA-directed RNA polymerase
MDDALMQRQAALEAEMQGLGTEQFRARLATARENREESTTPYGLDMVSRAIEPLAQSIEAFIEKAMTGGRGRRHSAVKHLSLIDPQVAAFIIMKVVLDGITKPNTPASKVAMAIGYQLDNELHYQAFEQQQPKLYGKVAESVRRSSHRGYREKVMTYAANKYGTTFAGMSQQEKLHLGMACLDMMIETTGFAVIETTQLRKECKVHLVPTAKALDWINATVSRCELLSPMLLPMLVPPKPWTSPNEGGYHTNHVRRRLLKTSSGLNATLKKMADNWEGMATVREAVERIDRTGWRIRQDVLEVARWYWDAGITVGKLPPRDDVALPPCPVCGQQPTGDHEHLRDEEIKKLWKRDAARIHGYNAKLKSKRLQAGKILWLADKFKDEQAIYFPHQLDFRGRVYPMPLFLQPQGNDLAKGLLTFAKGKLILDEVAAGWLMIHGAGTYGYDKVSLDGRIGWVVENEARILACADDPIVERWWTEADKPWQFLAFCKEWANFKDVGYGFVSTLPISLDGSCNGLQHYSAMLRDPKGGKAVNLVPSNKPADIYQEVANVTLHKLRRIVSTPATNGDEEAERVLAQQWLDFGVTRKTTKRPVMVVPYSGTRHACRQYTQDHIEEEVEARKLRDPSYVSPWPLGELLQPTLFLTRLVWTAIGEVVVAARKAMDWLKKVSAAVSKANLPIEWVTPAGFPVHQAYYDTKSRRVFTRLGDNILMPRLQEYLPTINAREQGNAFPPNFVHSLDAAALQLSVCYAADNGIEEFAMVHDSYGCPAADAEMLGQCLRLAFVEMYQENNVLADLKANVEAALGSPLPEPPAMGTLDLELIKQSDFFFA